MSIGKALGRVGIVLSVAVAVGLIGCDGGDKGTTPPPTGTEDPTIIITDSTTTINGLTWMRQNLNIETPDSWCYEDKSSNCAKYGRLYTWEAAKSVCASMGGKWRLPTKQDWDNLVDYAGGDIAGKKLKSKSGWENNFNGTDDYGFSALPGGTRSNNGSFRHVGSSGFWWSATEDGTSLAYERSMRYADDDVSGGGSYRSTGFSVRCVED